MFCYKNSVKNSPGSAAVHLNVYDFTSINGYACWLGLGVYHSGVQVHGVEYAFAGHEYPTSGIFKDEPKQCQGFSFRKSILIGWTELTTQEVREMMDELADQYTGVAYNLMTKNCNHFSNEVCIRLTGNGIPSWVNRLARIGLLCRCVIPDKFKPTKVQHHKIEEGRVKNKKLTSRSNRFANVCSSSSSSSPTSPPPDATAAACGSRRGSFHCPLNLSTN